MRYCVKWHLFYNIVYTEHDVGAATVVARCCEEITARLFRGEKDYAPVSPPVRPKTGVLLPT